MAESLVAYNNKYCKGEPYGGLHESRFSAGEGFGQGFTNAATHTISTPHIYSAGPDPELRTRFTSAGAGANHNIQIKVNNAAITTVDSTNYYNYRMRQVAENFALSTLNSSNTITLNGMA